MEQINLFESIILKDILKYFLFDKLVQFRFTCKFWNNIVIQEKIYLCWI